MWIDSEGIIDGNMAAVSPLWSWDLKISLRLCRSLRRWLTSWILCQLVSSTSTVWDCHAGGCQAWYATQSLPLTLLVPDMHYQSSREECIADHQYNSAYLAGILEVLMFHGTSSDKSWSQEALNSGFRLSGTVHERESIGAASLTVSWHIIARLLEQGCDFIHTGSMCPLGNADATLSITCSSWSRI